MGDYDAEQKAIKEDPTGQEVHGIVVEEASGGRVSPGRSWLRRRVPLWVVVGLCALLVVTASALGIGLSSASSEASSAKSMLAAAQRHLSEAEGQRDSAKSDAASAKDQAASADARAKASADAAVASERADLKAKQAQLDQLIGAAHASQFHDGLFEVGRDIQPGKYHADAATGCYWAKLRSSNTSDIADNDNAKGPVTIVIDSPYFKSSDCGTWTKVG